jgi:hypothetical protein
MMMVGGISNHYQLKDVSTPHTTGEATAYLEGESASLRTESGSDATGAGGWSAVTFGTAFGATPHIAHGDSGNAATACFSRIRNMATTGMDIITNRFDTGVAIASDVDWVAVGAK